MVTMLVFNPSLKQLLHQFIREHFDEMQRRQIIVLALNDFKQN